MDPAIREGKLQTQVLTRVNKGSAFLLLLRRFHVMSLDKEDGHSNNNESASQSG